MLLISDNFYQISNNFYFYLNQIYLFYSLVMTNDTLFYDTIIINSLLIAFFFNYVFYVYKQIL